jgi:RHS repeat-associated protein
MQTRWYTTYERDENGSYEAMNRRYNRWWSRFEQPDPWDGSYDLTDPQSFNRYSYVRNDPVNFVDPSGLDLIDIGKVGDVTVIGGADALLLGGGGGSWDDIPDRLAVVSRIHKERSGLDPSDPQNPDCLTPLSIINDERFTKSFEDAWNDTKKSGNENGGWIFYDQKANTTFIIRTPEGNKSSLGEQEWEAYNATLRKFRENGQSVWFMGMFHTHPGMTPSSSQGDAYNINYKSQRDGAGRDRVGIIIYGPGKYSFYDGGGPLYRYDDATHPRLNDCL